jgi:hypothetical protein
MEMNFNSSCFACGRLMAVSLLLLSASAFADKGAPSRPPVKGCEWVKLADDSVGLEAWVQQCDFGFRKIDFIFQENTLAMRFSDGGKPDPVIDVIDLLPRETIEAGLKRFFAAHTNKSLAKRCVLKVYPRSKPPKGAKRYTFVPDAAYRKELKAQANSDEIAEPPCGDWGDGPEGVEYFEAWPGGAVRRVLYVREGQDEPLFDAHTLHLIAPH